VQIVIMSPTLLFLSFSTRGLMEQNRSGKGSVVSQTVSIACAALCSVPTHHQTSRLLRSSVVFGSLTDRHRMSAFAALTRRTDCTHGTSVDVSLSQHVKAGVGYICLSRSPTQHCHGLTSPLAPLCQDNVAWQLGPRLTWLTSARSWRSVQRPVPPHVNFSICLSQYSQPFRKSLKDPFPHVLHETALATALGRLSEVSRHNTRAHRVSFKP
jgi:hypothetical protein